MGRFRMGKVGGLTWGRGKGGRGIKDGKLKGKGEG